MLKIHKSSPQILASVLLCVASVTARAQEYSPILLKPEDGENFTPEKAVNPGIAFRWTTVPDAEYILYLTVNDGDTAEIPVSGSLYQRGFGSAPGTTVEWYVRSIIDDIPVGRSEETRTFTIGDPPTPTPTLGPATPTPTPSPTFPTLPAPQPAAPPDGTHFSPQRLAKGIALQWSEVEGAVSYRVTSAVNGMVQQPQISDATESTLAWTVSDGDSIRWAVQAIGASGETSAASLDWGLVADAAVTPTPTPTGGGSTLPAPTLIFPPDNLSLPPVPYNQTLKIAFEWSHVPGAAEYRLQIEEAGEVLQIHEAPEIPFDVFLLVDRDYNLTWSVSALAEDGTPGEESAERTLSLASGPTHTPTETPVYATADLNRDALVDGIDLFHLAGLYGSEDAELRSALDLDESGSVDKDDLVLFIQEYRTEQ